MALFAKRSCQAATVRSIAGATQNVGRGENVED